MFDFDPARSQDAKARYTRFEKIFNTHAALNVVVDDLLDREAAKFKVKDLAAPDLCMVVGASLAKAMKTFDAIHNLCLLGAGADALVLLRSSVNLLINLGYILGGDDPNDRAADFICYGYLERVKYFNTAHGASPMPPTKYSDEELRSRARRWGDVTIKQRADSVPDLHYTQGYKLYSSIEHSDAMALNSYIADDWNESGLRLIADASDEYIDVALGHSVMVLADIVVLFCAHFDMEQPEQLQVLVSTVTEA